MYAHLLDLHPFSPTGTQVEKSYWGSHLLREPVSLPGPPEGGRGKKEGGRREQKC